MKHIFWILILVLLSGCGQFQAKTFSTSPSTSTCKAISVATASETEPLFFTHTKIHTEDFFPAFSTQKAASQILKAQKGLSIVIDRACFFKRGIDTDLFKFNEFQIKEKSENYSPTDSVFASLNQDIEFSELLAIVDNESCIVGLSQNVKMHTTEPNDPYYRTQRHLSAIGYESTYDFFYNSTSGVRNDIVIAVIDNGTDIDHPDLAPLLWRNAIEAAGRAGVDDDENGYIDDINGWDFASDNNNPRNKFDDDHGTHTAGLAAARGNNQVGVSGVMGRNIKLMALNVFGEIDGADISNIDQAIRYAADNGAKIINLSLGGLGRISSTGNAIQYAVSRGVTVFAAAGNDGIELSSTQFFTPGSFAREISGMISVGAANASNKNQKCSFSNYSSQYVELAAPGCDSQNPSGLLSTLSGGLYGYMYGTSMASPIAAGAGALTLQMLHDFSDTNISPAQLEEIILSNGSAQSFPNNFVRNNRHLDLIGISNYIRTTARPTGCTL